jgi:hypothetical protein
MNDGGTFTDPPAYRTKFYADVVNLATEVCSSILISVVRELIVYQIEGKTNELIENGGQVPALETNENVRAIASSFLDLCGDAIVVLSFDEAHELGANPIMPSNSSTSKRAPTRASRQNITMFSHILKGLRSVLNSTSWGSIYQLQENTGLFLQNRSTIDPPVWQTRNGSCFPPYRASVGGGGFRVPSSHLRTSGIVFEDRYSKSRHLGSPPRG